MPRPASFRPLTMRSDVRAMRAAAWYWAFSESRFGSLVKLIGLKVPLNAALGIPIAIAGAVMEVVTRKRKS